MIEHKMRDVPDSVCQKCPQLWEGECRAFCVSHSEEERIHRTVASRWLPCQAYKHKSGPKFPDEMDVKSLLLVAGAVILILLLVRFVG